MTLGDVAGVGPEVAVKALLDPSIESECIPILIGELSTIRYYAERLTPERQLRVLKDPGEAQANTHSVQIIDLKNVEFSRVKLGKMDVNCGRAALDYIRAGVDLCLKKKLDAIVTGPIYQ